MHTDKLRTGPRTRKGRYLSKRGRCVSCYSLAPIPIDGGGKFYMGTGESIPQVCYACDVCRVHLCRQCFQDVYDHHTRGVPDEVVTLR